MTHEIHEGDEHGGPQHDHSLPDADTIPTYATPEESDATPLDADLDGDD